MRWLIVFLLVSLPAAAQPEPSRNTCLKVRLLDPPRQRSLTVTKAGCPPQFAVCMTPEQASEFARAVLDLVGWIDDTLRQCHKGNGV